MTTENISRTASSTTSEPPESLVQLVPLRAWLILVAIGCVLVPLLLWAFWGELRTTESYRGMMVANGSRDVVIYLPVEAAETVRAGMSVQIKPFTSDASDKTYHGALTEVGDLPASTTQMRAVLGDEVLVESVRANGPMIQTRVLCDGIPDETGIVMSKVIVTTRVEHPIDRLFPAELTA